ncbi:uncharacterized protein [Drosophila kikkawai]|uniref:Uncharacterized protein n=1 Tax=Drosophila kikkawai TaxID=30033 RepID=A0ABM4GHA5_DROKI
MTKATTRSHLLAGNLLVVMLLLTATGIAARRLAHRRLIIHVPVKTKTHHHTHTVYKVVHAHGGGGGGHGGIKQTVYKVMGFASNGAERNGNGMSKGLGGGGGGGGASGGGGNGGSVGYGSYDLGGMGRGKGHGEITYEDMHDCESGKVAPATRDMIFNHYSRHGETGGSVEDYAEEMDDFIDLRDAYL